MSVGIRELLEAGAHFGHQTHRWNPKMKPYIYGQRNGIYIINLELTVHQWKKARAMITKTVTSGKKVLFVGTKPQVQDILQEEATRAKQFYVNKRWLGGMLTNFRTIKIRIDRLDEIDQIKTSDKIRNFSKKQIVDIDKEYEKLDKSLHGIRDMRQPPGLVFVVDPKKEHLAIREAKRLFIPVIAITDTNCDPDGIDYVIPANDDALKSVSLFLKDAADACLDGSRAFEEKIQEESRQRLKAEAEAKKQQEARASQATSAATVSSEDNVVSKAPSTNEQFVSTGE